MASPRSPSLASDLFLIGPQSGAAKVTAELAGGKAGGLWRIAKLGLTVPPAFVLSTRLCEPVNEGREGIDHLLEDMLMAGITYLEKTVGKRFGDARRPLLVSVRSGAARSMPGMMQTVLNVGMNERTVRGLIRLSGNPRLAWDSYRRFVQGYGEVVCHAEPQLFSQMVAAAVRAEQAEDEACLDAEALERLSGEFLALIEESTGLALPADPYEQLTAAVRAVFHSWNSERARHYRRMHGFDDLLGTAVTVQTMVFGNAGVDSGAGVAFSRNPSTGEKALYADFLFDAQGEDVVSGRRKPVDICELAERLPKVASELAEAARALEAEFKDMQDIEFCVEDGRLFFLQTRDGKRTPRAGLAILVDLVEEGIISEEEGARRAQDIDFEAAAVSRFSSEAEPVGKGVPASAGVACGRAAFSSEAAQAMAKSGDPIILVRQEPATDDVAGFAAAVAILTASGGRTAHAAVVARQLGKVCVVGCEDLDLDVDGRHGSIGGHKINEGDWICLDGETGAVTLGKREIVRDAPSEAIAKVKSWAEHHKPPRGRR